MEEKSACCCGKEKEKDSGTIEVEPVEFKSEDEALDHASKVFWLTPGAKVLVSTKDGPRKAVITENKGPYIGVLFWQGKDESFLPALTNVAAIMPESYYQA